MNLSFALAPVLFAAQLLTAQTAAFRPPAVPLVAHDPYFSIWSVTDHAGKGATRHWTGRPQRLTSLARIDGRAFRLMGDAPDAIEALPQTSVRVLPTRSILEYAGQGVRLTLTFLTPALPRDLEVLSRPLTYVVWDAAATDGREHSVSLYFDASARVAVNTPDQETVRARFQVDGLSVLRAGSAAQPVLEKFGDDVRIDWGHLYLAGEGAGLASAIAGAEEARKAFLATGRVPASDAIDDGIPARRGHQPEAVLAFTFDLGSVGARPASRMLMLAYDDVYSVEYLNRRLRPWWRRNGADARALLRAAHRDYASLAARSKEFDERLTADLARMGGEKYAVVCSLAYRQTLAAHKLVADADGTAFYFPKENFSNGCIGTVDVISPSGPFFLLLNPELLKAQLTPMFQYAATQRWRFPFAPHDLGTYPHANGQVYGGGEETEEDQMPVEESGNMLILTAALATIEGNAQYAAPYMPLLRRWAEYLKEKGMDPENQLATNDMSGHLAHNTDLSIKAILGMGAYGKLAKLSGRDSEAESYLKLARGYAQKWAEMAADGDHYRLAFDRPGTWSQKHNLIWDRILGLHLFPAEVGDREVAFYKTKVNRYGLPFDNRKTYSLADWTIWTASLARSADDFQFFVEPIYRFLNDSPDRVPFTDWYETLDAQQIGWVQDGRKLGFQGRSVVGGVYMRMLTDEAMWKKWARP